MKLQLIEHWRQGWKFHTTWAFAVLLAGPDIYTAAQTLGLLADGQLPQSFVWAIRGIAAVGLVARFVQQKKPEPKP